MSGGGNLPIGPGIWGFIAFFVLAVALWFLVRNMNSRLRRMAYRDRERAQEEATRDGLGADRTDASGPDATSGTGTTDGPDVSGGDGTDPQAPTR